MGLGEAGLYIGASDQSVQEPFFWAASAETIAEWAFR